MPESPESKYFISTSSEKACETTTIYQTDSNLTGLALANEVVRMRREDSDYYQGEVKKVLALGLQATKPLTAELRPATIGEVRSVIGSFMKYIASASRSGFFMTDNASREIKDILFDEMAKSEAEKVSGLEFLGIEPTRDNEDYTIDENTLKTGFYL